MTAQRLFSNKDNWLLQCIYLPRAMSCFLNKKKRRVFEQEQRLALEPERRLLLIKDLVSEQEQQEQCPVFEQEQGLTFEQEQCLV